MAKNRHGCNGMDAALSDLLSAARFRAKRPAITLLLSVANVDEFRTVCQVQLCTERWSETAENESSTLAASCGFAPH